MACQLLHVTTKMMDSFVQDLRLALRRLRQTPGFTAVAILTLALGIGANTTVFSALNWFLLRPLPVERPNELVFLNRGQGITFSYPAYKDIRDRNQVFSGLIAYRISPMSLTQGGKSARVWGLLASGNYFQTLGVQAIRGRMFTPEEDQKEGAHPVAVLSYGCWQRRFGGDPNIVGKAIKINGLDFTVLGIAPTEFHGMELLYSSEIWVPMMMEPQIEIGNPWLNVRTTKNVWLLGRLKPGVTQAQAEASLAAVADQLGREHPSTDEGMKIILSQPGLAGNWLRGTVTSFTSVLMGVAGLVLLIACINLASLLLSRAVDRRKETAVRLALGASRGRLIRQLLTENLLVSLAGGAAGVLIAMWLTDLIAAWRPPVDFPLPTEFPLDWRVIAFSFGLSLLTTLLFGLAPALQSTRTALVPALKNEPVSSRLRRWQSRDVLVVLQMALSVVLLVGSVLVVRSLQHALTMKIGYNPDHAVSVSFELGLQGYNKQQGRAFQKRVVEKIATLPGIQSAGLINAVPLSLDISNTGISVEGRPVPKPSEMKSAIYYNASPGYFRTAQTRFLAGRDFEERDREETKRVAIINHAFTQKILQTKDAVGKRFHYGSGGDWIEVIGVVEDGKYASLGEEPTPVVFRPLYQDYNSTTTLVARSPLPSKEALRLIQHAVQEMDSSLPLYDAGSLSEHLEFPLLPARLAASVLGSFGFLAILLAAIGMYGVMAYAVARRTREIGIRITVGATRNHILRLVLHRTTTLLIAGVVLGAAGALAMSQIFAKILYGVNPKDPSTFLLATLLMATVAIAACWLPARRAMRIDPVTALREE